MKSSKVLEIDLEHLNQLETIAKSGKSDVDQAL